MYQQKRNSKIVVLGGGTAGWLSALFIQRNYKNVDITVIEDPSKPPIIAGESGTTTFTDFLLHLKIDKDNFIRTVNATPKLGGRFVDWNGVGTEFVHCLQTDFSPWLDDWTDYIKNVNDDNMYGASKKMLMSEYGRQLYLKTLIANDIPLEQMFYSGAFIRENKVPFGAFSPIPCVPMWHFESRASAQYFKSTALDRGIQLLEAQFQTATLDNQGNITELILDNNRKISADWFIDCSGFSRLLLGKTLQEPLVDYSNIFPANSVVAWWDKPCYTVTTNATAMKYGWSWNINLRHRSGNGYLYDSNHISLDQAVQEAELRFNKKIEPIANFTFSPGTMKNLWKNNVIGVGLSSGFLEPLEANGVAIIIETLYGLADHWNPHGENTDYDQQRFNYKLFSVTEDIKDFLSLHYRGHRNDTEFWKDHKNNSLRVSDTLREKLHRWELFYKNLSDAPTFNGYSAGAWLTVLQGLSIFDNTVLKQDLKRNLDLGKKVLNTAKSKYMSMVAPCWTIDQWISYTR